MIQLLSLTTVAGACGRLGFGVFLTIMAIPKQRFLKGDGKNGSMKVDPNPLTDHPTNRPFSIPKVMTD